jgi:uncharacterized protein YidB (DUF937 family)
MHTTRFNGAACGICLGARGTPQLRLTSTGKHMFEGLAKTLKDLLPDAGDALVDKAMGAINDAEHGGLAGVVEKFRAGGMGDTVNSWIAKGKANLPITAEQLKSVLSNEQITSLAKKMGIDPAQAADKLAALLPHAVDAATPDGTLPPAK